MISLSHDLGYRVVAEGVDTAEAADCSPDGLRGAGLSFSGPWSRKISCVDASRAVTSSRGRASRYLELRPFRNRAARNLARFRTGKCLTTYVRSSACSMPLSAT